MRPRSSARARAFGLGVALSVGFGAPEPARAQLSVSNLLEVQAGNTPFREPPDRTDLYSQTQLDYLLPQGHVGLRFELDENSEDRLPYRTVTQRWAEWNDDRVRLRVGNFYTLLGRGLTHRSFELGGVVLDMPGLRSRYGPSRDVDGVLAEGTAGPASARLFTGRPNIGDISPGAEDFGLERYVGLLSGGQIEARFPLASRAGATFVRYNVESTQREMGSGFVEIDPLALVGAAEVALPIYAEYAVRDGSVSDWLDLATEDGRPHAFYSSANLLWGAFAMSAEWKDYSGFRTSFNDPPSLVREHAWTLLNRGTHVLDAEFEEGYQVEASWGGASWGTVTANASRSDGEFGTRPARFEERYVELHVAPRVLPPLDATLFIDSGRDDWISVAERTVAGGGATWRLGERHALALDVQVGDTRREFLFADPVEFRDTHTSVTASRAGLASIAVVWERSTDPDQESPRDFASPGIQPRHFVAAALQARLSPHHEATLFVGERRGGRACTAGTCYDVASFEGVELRLLSRF